MLLSIVGRGGMGIQQTAKTHWTQNIYQLMEALMIRGITFKSSQHQVPCIVILSILEYLVQNCVCVCVRAREHVCDIYFKSCISQVKLYKIHGRYYVERGCAFSSSSFFFFFFFFFSFFLITSNINIIGSSSFYSRRIRKIKKKKKN